MYHFLEYKINYQWLVYDMQYTLLKSNSTDVRQTLVDL